MNAILKMIVFFYLHNIGSEEEAINIMAKERILKQTLKRNENNKSATKYFMLANSKVSANAKDYEGKYDPDNPENETNFNKAYNKLAQKIAAETDPKSQILVTNRELRHIEIKTAKDPQILLSRARSLNEITKKRLEEIKEELEYKEMKECTFAPKISDKRKQRSLQKFLDAQQKHMEKRQENVQRMIKDIKEREEESITSLPKINGQPKLFEKTESVYERLFLRSKKAVIVNPKSEERPTIKNEGTPRGLLLYEYAKKKQEFVSKKQKEEKKSKLKTIPYKYAKDPYVKKKFNKEFNAIVKSIGDIDQNKGFTYIQMRKICMLL